MSSALSTARTASVVMIAAATFLAGCSSGASSPAAAGTVAVVDVQPVEGGTAPNMPEVALRLRQLLSAMGFADVQVEVTGSTRVTARVDGAVSPGRLQAALEPGPLLFRKVLNAVPDESKGSVPTAPGRTSSADVSLDAVKAAVGNPAWAAAMILADRSHGAPVGPRYRQGARAVRSVDASRGGRAPCRDPVLRTPDRLRDAECADARRDRQPQATVAVCDNSSTKYLLDVAKASGSDVGSASAAPGASSLWAVNIAFSSTGIRRWTALTTEAFNNDGGRCILTHLAAEARHAPVCEVALLQDNKVLTAQTIQAVLSSEAQLAGSFSKEQAMTLAAQLALAGLSVRIKVLSVRM